MSSSPFSDLSFSEDFPSSQLLLVELLPDSDLLSELDAESESLPESLLESELSSFLTNNKLYIKPIIVLCEQR
jgi:hypothetical protein